MHWLVHFSITNVYTCLLLHGWMDSSIHLLFLFLFFIFTIFSISPPTQVIIYSAEEAEDTKKKMKAHRHKEKRLAGLLLLACFYNKTIFISHPFFPFHNKLHCFSCIYSIACIHTMYTNTSFFTLVNMDNIYSVYWLYVVKLYSPFCGYIFLLKNPFTIF